MSVLVLLSSFLVIGLYNQCALCNYEILNRCLIVALIHWCLLFSETSAMYDEWCHFRILYDSYVLSRLVAIQSAKTGKFLTLEQVRPEKDNKDFGRLTGVLLSESRLTVAKPSGPPLCSSVTPVYDWLLLVNVLGPASRSSSSSIATTTTTTGNNTLIKQVKTSRQLWRMPLLNCMCNMNNTMVSCEFCSSSK